jgi:hypothetical protein
MKKLAQQAKKKSSTTTKPAAEEVIISQADLEILSDADLDFIVGGKKGGGSRPRLMA